jgi:hypothetical protein
MSDEFEMVYPPTVLQDAVKSKDRRVALEAIRDYVAHELEANLCKTCAASRLRTGDQAALVLRLTKVLEEIAELPVNDGQISRVDEIRQRRDSKEAQLGSKSSSRQQGGRKRST